MGICIDAACRGCPDWVITLAVIGGLVVYLLLGLLFVYMIKVFRDDLDWDILIVFMIFWPLVIVGGIAAAIIYYVFGYIFKLFAMPIVGVDKFDLKESEDKIIDKIDTKITREDNKIMNYLEYDYVQPKRTKKPVKVKAGKKKEKKKAKK